MRRLLSVIAVLGAAACARGGFQITTAENGLAVVIDPASVGPTPTRDTAPRRVRFSGEGVVYVRAAISNGEDCGSIRWNRVDEHAVSDEVALTPTANVPNAVCAIGADAQHVYQARPSFYAFVVDTEPPAVTAAILADGAPTIVNSTTRFSIEATDNLSAVSAMNIVESPAAPDNWRAFDSDTNVTVSALAGEKAVYAQVRDAAGNVGERVLSNSVFLDYGRLPSLVVQSPDGTVRYSGGASIDIRWSCTSDRPLDPLPIRRIAYTTDNGATFSSIADGIADATGSYSWTLPAVVTGAFRIGITCRTIGGLDFTQLSQVINTPVGGHWRVWLGDSRFQGSVAQPVAIQSALLSNNNGFFVSDTNDLYIARGNQVLRVDAQTNLTSYFIGNGTAGGGCALADGPASSSAPFANPQIIGGTPDGRSFFFTGSFMNPACQQIWRVDTNTAMVERVATGLIEYFPAFGFGTHLSQSLDFYYWDGFGVLRTVSLRRDNGVVATATVVGGINGSCSPLPSDGTAMAGRPLPCNVTVSDDAAYGPLFTDGSGSRLFIFPRFGSATYRLDRDSEGVWRAGVPDTGLMLRQPDTTTPYNCVAAQYRPDGNARVLCSSEFTETPVIQVIDPDAPRVVKVHAPPAGAFTSAVEIGLASSSTNVYALTNFGQLLTAPATFNEDQEWSWQDIGPELTGAIGNGTFSSIGEAREDVIFDNIFDIKTSAAAGITQVIVREASRSTRRVTLQTSPIVDTAFNPIIDAPVSVTGVSAGSGIFGINCEPTFLYRFDFGAWTFGSTPLIYPSLAFANGGGNCFSLVKDGAYPSAVANTGASSGGFMVPRVGGTVVHSSGRLYFGGSESNGNRPRVFEVANNTVRSVAGNNVAPAYTGDGALAQAAGLTRVDQVVADDDGSLLIFDATRIRRVAFSGTDPGNITLVGNTSTFSGYSDGGTWDDVAWRSPCLYWSRGLAVRRVCSFTSGTSVFTYDLAGTELTAPVRLAAIDDGLLIAEPARRRILIVDP